MKNKKQNPALSSCELEQKKETFKNLLNEYIPLREERKIEFFIGKIKFYATLGWSGDYYETEDSGASIPSAKTKEDKLINRLLEDDYDIISEQIENSKELKTANIELVNFIDKVNGFYFDIDDLDSHLDRVGSASKTSDKCSCFLCKKESDDFDLEDVELETIVLQGKRYKLIPVSNQE